MTKNRPWPKLLVYTFLFVGVSLLVHSTIMAGAHNTYTKGTLLTATQLLWNALAFGAAVYAAKQSALVSRQAGRAWSILALAQLVLVSIYLIVLGTKLDLGLSEQLVYASTLFYYPLMLVGILSLPTKRLTALAWWKTALDLAIVLLSATLILWDYWLRPLMAAAGVAGVELQVFALAYPVGHLVLLWALLLGLYRGREGQPSLPVYLLVFNVGLALVSDFNFGYQTVSGTYQEGTWLDAGWALSPLVFGLAAIWQATAVTTQTVPAHSARPIIAPLWLNTWLTYLPYGFAVAAYLVLETNELSAGSGAGTVLSWSVGLIIGLVLLRQFVTIQENRQINQALQVEIGERQRAEARLAHDAVHDALTGLPNRLLLMDRLRHAIEWTKRRTGYCFSLLFLDLDHFKVVNDSLGHTVGDQLLIGIAQRLRLSLGAGDTVARLGGDEFIILLEDTADVQQATATANRILTTLQQPFQLNGHQVFASVSIGIVAGSGEYNQPEEVLRDADIAMYQAKTQGKARSELFNINLRAKAQTRLELENDLREALEREELELHYQPILALQSDRITGFEALLRWHHPQRGLLAPNEFIPIAEETGLMIPIGQWVLAAACGQLRAWQLQFPQTPPLTMSVNISGVQFAAPNFSEQVAELLHELGLDPSTLRLELTESVWLNSTSDAVTLFRTLSQMGIQLHIDDFGTGYSSLAYLQHFPIRTLKIDRMFLHKMAEDSNSKDLVRAVIAMAHDLGMEAVAEGVETVEQLNDLKQFGCNYGQGYLLSRPINRAGIEELLETTHVESTSPPRQTEGVRFGGRMLLEQPVPVS